ncbi:lamin L3 isoform X1 [Salvelinus fontinalis]|uniref:lamin L3 isoform X1 n=1 Tax=Salvelinus fontinalis TaxID=8038 RepID=UPI0024864DE4|nr:lamin L3 isoform X1 [Salvelinus fontinalis]
MASVTSTSRSTRSSRRSGAGPSSTSPTRLSRSQEKEELSHLNDRLAAYIERVRQLENDKSSMLLLLEEKEESTTRETANVRRLYETELADARKSLDVLANDRARLQIEMGHLSEEHSKLQARNQKKEAECNMAMGQWRNLEAVLNSKDAELANQLADNRRQADDVTDLQAQVANLECALAETKTQLNSEMLRRVDLENQVQTLREQLEFQRHIGEQEVREIRSRHESRLVEVDSGRQKEFESKLAEAMQQLRQEHDGQIQQYKEDLEKNFNAKLENAHQTALKSSDFASSTREELSGTKLRIETLSSQLNHFQKQNGALEGRVRELERTLDREREVWQQRLSHKDEEMSAMRAQMQSQLEDYEQLLDVKLALDMEINAYRKMLEGEEQRLHLSPSPSQHGAVARTHGHGARRVVRGKKRKNEGGTGSSPAYKVSQHTKAHSHMMVSEIDLKGNYVTLKNNSEKEQPLGGWVVRRSHLDSPELFFQIPPSYILAGGNTLTIWGSEAGGEASPGDLVMKNQRNWGPVNNVIVTLLNPDEEETAELRVQERGEEDSDVEVDEELLEGSDVHYLRRQTGKCCTQACTQGKLISTVFLISIPLDGKAQEKEKEVLSGVVNSLSHDTQTDGGAGGNKRELLRYVTPPSSFHNSDLRMLHPTREFPGIPLERLQ